MAGLGQGPGVEVERRDEESRGGEPDGESFTHASAELLPASSRVGVKDRDALRGPLLQVGLVCLKQTRHYPIR